MTLKQKITGWFRRGEREQSDANSGQAIVLIGVASIALIAIMGLAIDGGRLLFLSRETQNAADAAALAAARAMCAQRTDYQAAAFNAARANGFDNDEVAGTVEVNIPPVRSSVDIGDNCVGCYVEVVIRGEIPPSFIGVVYDGPLAATSHAIGACNPNEFNYTQETTGDDALRAMWGIGDSCRTEVTGSTITVIGGAHANGELDFNPKMGGGTIVGPASYYGSWHNPADKSKWCPPDDCGDEYGDLVSGSGGDTTTTPAGLCRAACFADDGGAGSGDGSGTYPDTNPYQVEESQPDPLKDRFKIEEFRPGGAQAIAAGANYYSYTGGCSKKGLEDWFAGHTSGSVMDTGLYYTSCDIEMKQWNGISGTVTFVTEGSIKVVSNDNTTLLPYVDGLLLFANGGGDSCSSKTIQFSGSSNNWTGILYAPHGEVKFAASTNSSNFWGCVVGYDVKFSGSNNMIRCEQAFPETTGGGDPGIWISE